MALTYTLSISIIIDTNAHSVYQARGFNVGDLIDVIQKLQKDPQNIRYEQLYSICVLFFGEPRQKGTSHAVFKTPWPGDPRVNIQRGKNGKAKIYQVRQVLAAINRIKEVNDE